MHNKKIANLKLLPLAIASVLACGVAQQATAEIMLYDKDDTTFSTDGYVNAFYVNSDVDREDDVFDRRQSRVKMGFLPNWIGFNFGKQIDDLKLGGRSSFWVTINDSETNGTDTAIDVRQFYGTVANPDQLGGRGADTARGWHQEETMAPSITAWLSNCAHSLERRNFGGTSCTLTIPASRG